MTIDVFPADRKYCVSLYDGKRVLGEAFYHADSDTWDYDSFTPDGSIRVYIGEFDQLDQIIELEEGLRHADSI